MTKLPTPEQDAAWNPCTGLTVDPQKLQVACGPADGNRRRLVFATLFGITHRDRFDTDDGFKRKCFREECARRFGVEDSQLHEALEEKIAAAADQADARAEGGSAVQPSIVKLADVAPEQIAWLWRDRIPLGKLTLLVGNPGLGKSLVSLDIGARVSRGAPWPDRPNEPQPAGGVVLLSAEDDLGDTIRPRLDAHEADVSRIVALTGVEGIDADGQYRRGVDLARDIDQLRAAIAAVEGCRLVIVDPISAYLGKTDSHKNSDVRAVLAPLSELAADKRVAVLAVTHLRKGEGQAIYRTMGSLAFVAAARCAWLIAEDSASKGRRLMLPIKSNIAPDTGGLAYAIAPHGPDGSPVVCWEREPVTVTADEAIDAQQQRKRGPDPAERAEAAKWLRQALADGPQPAREIMAEADDQGFSKRTIQRAFQEIGGRREKRGFSGGWLWSLPEDATKMPTPPGDKQPGTFGETWHLRENPEDDKMERRCQVVASRKMPSSESHPEPDTFDGNGHDGVPF